MAYWLVKSEPEVYAFDQLMKDKETRWDGVRNYAARIHLRAMKKGDPVLYYHSNTGMEIVGIAAVSREAGPDPADDPASPWVAVYIKGVKKLPKPVPLPDIKKDKKLQEMALVRLGRLSVQPVTEAEWKIIMKKAGLE